MTKIFLMISLGLLIGIVLSIPSKHDNSKSREDAIKRSSDKKNKHSSHRNEKHDKTNDHETDNRNDEDKDERSKSRSHGSREHHHKESKRHKSDDKHKKHHKRASKDHQNDHKAPNDRAKSVEREEVADNDDDDWTFEHSNLEVDTRRILYSKTTSKGKRPYMVYLQLTKESAKAHKYRGWLCGGVIVHKYYVLTSAACVEDADHFYVVSGTRKFIDSFDYKNDECACKNRRKVVWKCIPKNYKFDFQDSIKWSSNDIAIVKVHKPFKFGSPEPGCEYGTTPICYNNVSRELEKPGTRGFIAGWGSGSNFREGVYRRATPHIPDNAKCLQEAKVCIMDNEKCAKKWSQKFRSIITQYMICTKDVMKRLSEICDKRYANCTDIERRQAALVASSNNALDDDPNADTEIDLGRHLRDPDDYTARRMSSGGFCENDHGGPLIVKYQNRERVIGVISACKIDPKNHGCHGPFLYTSVFKNRQFISCAIYKDTEEESCRRVFRTGITHEEFNVDWDGVPEDDEYDGTRAENNDDDDDDDKLDKKSSSSSSSSDESLRKGPNKNDGKNDRRSTSSESGDSNSLELRAGNKMVSQEQRIDSGLEEKKSDYKKASAEKHKDNLTAERSGNKKSSEEKHSKTEKKTKKHSDSSSSDSSDDSKENKKVRRAIADVFYESSRDENVNEPGSDE